MSPLNQSSFAKVPPVAPADGELLAVLTQTYRWQAPLPIRYQAAPHPYFPSYAPQLYPRPGFTFRWNLGQGQKSKGVIRQY